MLSPEQQDLVRLDEWLLSENLRDCLIPIANKRPLKPHMNGQWTRANLQDLSIFGNPVQAGLLLEDLVVVDIDSHPLIYQFEKDHEEWTSTAIRVKTSNGKHYVWKRSRLCESLHITDKARSLRPDTVADCFLDENGQVPIDIKTITSTGTRGLLVVAPTKNKEWETKPWGTKLYEIPDGLVNWLKDHFKKGVFSKGDKGGTRHNPTFQGDWDIPIELSLGQYIVEQALSAFGDNRSYFYAQKGPALYYKNDSKRICPFGEEHVSNNCWVHFKQYGAIIYHCWGTKCQGKTHHLGYWNQGVKEPSFDEEHYKELERPYLEQIELKPKHRDIAALEKAEVALVEYINHYFFVHKSNKGEVVQLTYDTRGNVIRIQRRSIFNHKQMYQQRFMRAWMADHRRRTYESMVFHTDLSLVGPRQFNMFQGLKVEVDNDVASTTLDMKMVTPFVDFIHEVWASKSPQVSDYLLNWLAYPLQKKLKTLVCVVLISQQGFGKGLIINRLVGEGIYGNNILEGYNSNYIQITDILDMVGRFNSLSGNRLFINANECSSWGGAHKQNDALKSLITDEKVRIEQKGLDTMNLENLANYVLTTNNADPIKAEQKDRRFVIIDVPPSNQKPPEVYKHMLKCINDGASLHFYKYLMGRDLSKFNPIEDRPITQAALDLMAANTPTPLLFLQSCVLEETIHIHGPMGNASKWTEQQEVFSHQLHSAYTYWYSDQKRKMERLGPLQDMRMFPKVIKDFAVKKTWDSTGGKNKILLFDPETVRQRLVSANCWL